MKQNLEKLIIGEFIETSSKRLCDFDERGAAQCERRPNKRKTMKRIGRGLFGPYNGPLPINITGFFQARFVTIGLGFMRI